DGSRLLMGCMSYDAARKYQYFMMKYHYAVLLAFVLLVFSPLKYIIIVPMNLLVHLFIGA
ncbi:MAG: hypothetical protein Q4E99_05145, partial [Bacillota bacterium]|nr:hypothetical protein [Bacillota bacterium]